MDSTSLSTEEHSQLLEAAQKAAGRAYAPYSKFRVGAAVLTELGELFHGCNIENASYGLTICAERAAIFAAVCQEGENTKIRAIAILTEHNSPAFPCGACRQVIFEFGPYALVLFQGNEGVEQWQAHELLPNGFTLK